MNTRNIFKKLCLISLVLGLFFVSKNVLAADVFRVTEYKITDFSSTTYNLNLNYDLSPNHFILIKGSESGNVIKNPASSYVKVSKLAANTNKSLPTTGNARLIELKRFSAGNGYNWVGVVTVVECIADCDVNGFKTLDVLDLSTPQYTSTTTRTQAGSIITSAPWSDINKVSIFGGGIGSGTNVESSTSNSGYFNSGWLRLYPSGTNTVNWERYNSNADNILSLSTHTIYAIQWGSAWGVQRVNISGSKGGAAANNANNHYNAATISSVTRANTWVYGTGYSQAAAVGNGSMGTLVTLGNGVAKNTTETSVAIGSQINGFTRMFDIYVMSHPNLAVDYQFKTNSGSGVATANVTTTSRADSRMAISYNGSVDNTNIYPAVILSSRYSSNTNIILERNYYPTTPTNNFAAWVQGIYFKNIQYTPQPKLNQFYYRWRDDTKSLNDNNGWLSTENTDPLLFSKNINYRIRFGVSNTGETDPTTGRSFVLQYGLKTTQNCVDISTWTNLGTDANFIPTSSTMYTNQASTSMLFSNPNSYTFIAGKGVSTSNTTNIVSLPVNNYTELEYNLKALTGMTDGRYCLRLYNTTDAKVLDSYQKYPEMLIGNYIVQDYYRWYDNNNLITPTNALANENLECFINEKENTRLRLNIQSREANLLSKQFILQYSKNNISGPWRNVSNPTTVDSWWNNNYSKRRKINFGTSHSLLPAGYTSSFNMNTQVALNSGDDIRVVFQKTTGEIIELDRVADVWYNTNSKIEFKLQSDIALNSNAPTDGNYYIYYGNVNAKNPPTNPNNIYSIYDDFSDSDIRSDWKIEDHDKVSGTSFTESGNTLNINAGGVDTYETPTPVDDYAAVYQKTSGDFEVTIKPIYYDNTGVAQNSGIMVKNDITKTQANNGYFIVVNNVDAGYITAWDSNNNGYPDAIYATSGVTSTWPHCLKLRKQGTTFTATYSADCITFVAMNNRTIADATSSQDVGMYVVSNAGDVLSTVRFDYFKLIKLVTTAPTMSLSAEELKNDWEFLDIANLSSSVTIAQLLLSNSNTGELYSEVNPTSLFPTTITTNQRGEYDFPLNSKNAEKTTYYFRLTRSDGSVFDEYINYAKLTIGNVLKMYNYRWYTNTNNITPTVPLALENTKTYLESKYSPVRLRLNVEDSLGTLKQNSQAFILQYAKNLTGPWNDVGLDKDWNFYDNNSVSSNIALTSTLLSNSSVLENYSEQNPTATNLNQISNAQNGEYDFSIIPSNATNGDYYFRLIKSTSREYLDDYINYPVINVNTNPSYNLYSYKFFNNIDSANVGDEISIQNTKATIQPNSDFRLRILMSVSKNNLLKDTGLFKIQYAEKGTGTCANPQYSYAVMTTTTGISLKNNVSVASDIVLTQNAIDPTHPGVAIKNQTYKETGDFSNSISDINAGEDGKWDFSLHDNNAGAGKTFCFKVVNVDGSNIDAYSAYPEISIVAGILSIDIVDNNGVSVSSPTFTLDQKTISYTHTNSSGLFGFNNQKIRISNTTSNPSWTASLSATYGAGAYWTNGSDSYDFNDSTVNAEDGFDADIIGGQMSIDPLSSGSITPKSGGNITGVSLSGMSSFVEGTQNSVTIATSSSAAQTNSYWDIMGINILQSIPARQASGKYSINLTLTIIGN